MSGVRVSVPFGRRTLVGIVLGELKHSDVPADKLRAVYTIHDREPLIPQELLTLLEWAAQYYQYPIGEVMHAALPKHLKKGKPALLVRREFFKWVNTSELPTEFDRAPVQRLIANFLMQLGGKSVASDSIATLHPRWKSAIKPLLNKGFVATESAVRIARNVATGAAPELLEEQARALQQLQHGFGAFRPFLLNGVTGSGKTEVYLRCIEAMSRQGMQSLVLVPEISLTPQLMQRFEQRLDGCLVSLHSALNDTERMQNWLCAASGNADVVIGTRSSVFVPLPRLGLVIVDEEHDSSFKQQDGFRYHARDLALMRARSVKCPVILGSATPSFESLHNVMTGKYTELLLTQRAGDSSPPSIALMDIRRRKLVEGLSDRMLDAIRDHVKKDGQVLIFINRRGFAPTLLCNDCGQPCDCRRCDAHMTVHARSNNLRCHHCGSERPMPTRCGSCESENLERVGYGTERIAQALESAFPDVNIVRIDRDTTRRKGALEAQLESATSGEAQILVGTQLLAKGHHFPKLTLVGILDADRGLFGVDFRSLEQMGQLIVQVAGRAGREERAGKVLIQTRNPDNPMLQMLVHEGYAAFASIAMDERKLAELPPYSYMALVRAEAVNANESLDFLLQVREQMLQSAQCELQVLGPVPAPMERLGGRFRAQLLLQSGKRSVLNTSLSGLCTFIDGLPGARRCRWSIDVDPVDLY